MRAGTYYAIAVLLVLATVPMYRYIFAHARDGTAGMEAARSSEPLPSPRIDVASLRRPMELPGFKVHYLYGEALPDGYKCSGAGGTVYRMSARDGVTELEVLKVGGVVVTCSGDRRSSIR